MRRRLLLALLPALVLPACGGGGGIQKQSLSDLVLRRQDVGKRFVAFYSGRQTQLDTQGTPRSDQSRFGREGGWIARYRRSGAPAANGPLVIESRADLFSGSGGPARTSSSTGGSSPLRPDRRAAAAAAEDQVLGHSVPDGHPGQHAEVKPA
jgi:hypothetical protein